MNSIEEIVCAVQKGDTEKYRFIIEKYQNRIYAYVYHLVGDMHEAEDVTQDVFVKAYDKIAYFRDNVSFSAWLYKIAYNHSINIIRRKKLIQMIPTFDFSTIKTMIHEPGTASCKVQFSGLMGNAFAKLNTEEKSLVVLRVLEEKSYEEISQILDIKAETLRKRYERARKKIQAYYEAGMKGVEKDALSDRAGC